MKKITGIRSVDFKIRAFGHGVVNWNGPTTLTGPGGKTVDNHTLPKLRGYSNLSGKVKEENDYKYKKEAEDIDFKETPLYISQNCIRHHLFRDHAFDLHYANKGNIKKDNIKKILCSITGLIRGYMIPSSQYKRTSPLLLEDFVDLLGNGNFEQFGQAGERDSTSFYSKTTFGDTEYCSFGSLSIEQIQFISLDNKFGRASININEGEGEEIALEITQFIKSINPNLKSEAIFHQNYVRNGAIFEEGEMGILLNDDAVTVLVDYTLQAIKELSIRQAKGYMYVDDIEVDYNDSNKMMRIKRDPSAISNRKNQEFAVYFCSKQS